jgi:hypothetical protein
VTERRVIRFEVPVDDQDHTLVLPAYSPLLKVGARKVDTVEFWLLEVPSAYPPTPRAFRVFGTGQPIPDSYTYLGTPEPVAGGALVWHLFERLMPDG